MPMWILGPSIPALQNDIQYHDWYSATLFWPFLAFLHWLEINFVHMAMLLVGESMDIIRCIMAQEHIVYAHGWALMPQWRTEVESLHTEIPRSKYVWFYHNTVKSKESRQI